jgi:hypothetical protein
VNLVEALARRVGPRTAGSAAAAAAAENVAGAFRELGLEPRFQDLPLLAYEPEEPTLEIHGERWVAAPCHYAQPTPPDGVTGRVRYLGTQVVVPGFFEPSAFAVEADGGEVARIYGNPLGGGAVPFSSGYGPILTGPSVYVSTADAERLRGLGGAPARVVVRGTFPAGRRDRTVLATLAGARDEVIVVSAHYDSVWNAPGAIDNASGVEGVRRIAERLVASGRRPGRTVVFAAFAAEEIGLLGARYFLQEAKLRGELGRLKAVVNLDSIGRGDKLQIKASPTELLDRAVGLARSLGLHERYDLDPRPSGGGTDEYPFWLEGIPAVSVLHWPYPEYHLPAETPELVDEQRLAAAVDLALALVESLLDDA